MEKTEPRRVTIGRQVTLEDPKFLPYYMEVIKRAGQAPRKSARGTTWRRVRSPVWNSRLGGKSTTHRTVGTGLLMGSSAGQHR